MRPVSVAAAFALLRKYALASMTHVSLFLSGHVMMTSVHVFSTCD